MRFLICFPEDGQTDQALVDGCRANGYEADFVCAHKNPHKLLTLLSKKKYDIVLCSRTIGLIPTFIRAQKAHPQTKFCVWNVDERENVEEWGNLLKLFGIADHYFVVSENGRWKFINPNTHFMPQGAQIELYHKPELTLVDREKYKCDVAFIGNITSVHKDRQEVLGYLKKNFDLKFFNVYGEEHNKACAVAKINIGLAHTPLIPKYASVRDWKIMAADGVLLTRYHPGYEELFPGVETFTTKEDCARKINEMLLDYPRYKKKAEELGEWVRTTQRYADRLKEIVRICETTESIMPTGTTI